MKTYLFVFNSLFGDRNQAISIIKQIPAINSWRSDMPNAIYFKSNSSAQIICDLIREIRGNGKFIVVEITANRQGYLSKETWNYLKIQTEEKDGI